MLSRRLTARRADRGFTLIEVAVAVAILTVGLLGILVLLVVQLKDQANASAQSQALHYAQDAVDAARRLPPAQAALAAEGWQALTTDPTQATRLAGWDEATGADRALQLALTDGRLAPHATEDGRMDIYIAVRCDPLPDGASEGPVVDCVDDADGRAFNRTVTVVAVPTNGATPARLVTRINATRGGTQDAGQPSDPAPGGAADLGIVLGQFDSENAGERGLLVDWNRVDGALDYTLTVDGEDFGDVGSGEETYAFVNLEPIDGAKAGAQMEVCLTANFSGSSTDPSCRTIMIRPHLESREDGPAGVTMTWNADPADQTTDGYRVVRVTGEPQIISGDELLDGGTFTDPDGTCADTYLIRAFPRIAPTPEAMDPTQGDEGQRYATATVEPTCGS